MAWILVLLLIQEHGYRATVTVPVHLIVASHITHMLVIVIVHGFVRVHVHWHVDGKK
jgi:hypothetical protein